MTVRSVPTSGVGDYVVSAPPELLDEWRGAFSRQDYIRLPGFFDRDLIAKVLPRIAEAEFVVRTHDRVGSEWVMKTNPVKAALIWLVNASELVRTIRLITGCDDVGYFDGRVYRLDPAPDQSFDWHDDCHEATRRLALSVNLSEQTYSGGTLQIREKSAPEEIATVPNVGPGDAVLFRIASHLHHRVMPVTGDVPKLSFTGWFRAGPSYHSIILQGGLAKLRGSLDA